MGTAEPRRELDLVTASRAIAASRQPDTIWDLVLETLRALDGVTRADVARAGESLTAPEHPASILQRRVTGGGRDLGLIQVALELGDTTPGCRASSEIDAVQSQLDLIAVVAGTALASTRTAAADEPEPVSDEAAVGDRRRMDRDVIDHSRAGQVGYLVFELTGAGDSVPDSEQLGTAVDAMTGATRDGDVVYVAGVNQFGVLLPGACRDDSVMVAERIRSAVQLAWTERFDRQPPLIGGVTSGQYEDPQRLAERAFAALEEARDGTAALVVDLAR